MNLHEYQGKQLFAEYGLPVSKGIAASTAAEAVAAADTIGGERWVVKAQVHAGGRGKAGGVKLVSSKQEIEAFANNWLGKNLVTYQTDANGQPVSRILVETCTDIDQELIWVRWLIVLLAVSSLWPPPKAVLRLRKLRKRHPKKFSRQSLTL